MKFNLGKLNIKETSTPRITGDIDINYNAELNRHILEKYQDITSINAEYGTIANAILEKTASTENIEIDFINDANSYVLVFSSECTTGLNYNSKAIGNLLGESYLELKGIRLETGQEIEIDMNNLAVTINGENALHLLDRNSDFFDFLQGDNEIEIVASGGTDMKTSTYWKDRWI